MDNNSSSTYIFSPRPDAHDMDWEGLLPPVRKAVRDLLLRLDGAARMVEDNMRDEKNHKPQMTTANCFLVHGDRGTGKTTVLLSAKRACNRNLKDAFFTFFDKEKFKEILDDKIQEKVYSDAKKSTEELQDIVWLDLLDLEPLPPKTNLLTTVLTRVRNALYPSNSEDSSIKATSILEERADSARHKLDQLIKDAALMWEDIDEPDTRSRANRQVAAADIYSKFQKNFRKAMDSLTQELAHRSATGKSHVQIVLPIDNIDRSTEHLYSIVKLAQMVSCHRFWLVLAGDRQDVETFLERAYWKELIRIGQEGAGATGKTGIGGEDEALVMARRQAAAASHKLLPPSHRVEVGLVSAEETLNFKPSNMSGNDKNISELLGAVRLVTEAQVKKEKDEEEERQARESETPNPSDNKTGNHSENDQLDLELFDLFDAWRLMQGIIQLDNNAERKDGAQSQAVEGAENAVNNDKITTQTDNNSGLDDTKKNAATERGTSTKKRKESYLTDAAQLGLRLPARGVLDLWQLTYWVTTDPTIEKHRHAETIARTMLRNVITESNMPSEIGRLLQEQIIRRTHQDGTLLDFQGNKFDDYLLDVSRVFSTDFTLPEHLYEPPDTNGELHQELREEPREELRGKLRGKLHGELSGELSGVRFEVLPEEYPDEFKNVVKSGLVVNQIKTLNLRLKYPSRKQNEDGHNDEPEFILLPDLVAAWLTILHDTLVLGAEDSDVIGVNLDTLCPNIVLSRHMAVTINRSNLQNQNNVIAQRLYAWPAPAWQSFIAHDVFSQFWELFLNKFEDARLPNVSSNAEGPTRLLVIGWVVCVLEAFLIYGKIFGWKCSEGKLSEINNDISSIKKCLLNRDECPEKENTKDMSKNAEKEEPEKLIKNTEIKVMKAALCAYKELQSNNQGEDYRAHVVRRIMSDWLEWELPYLLSHLYVPLPIPKGIKTSRAAEIMDKIMSDKDSSDSCLGKAWNDNLHFIRAGLGEQLGRLYLNAYIIYPLFEPFNDLDAVIAKRKSQAAPKPHPNSNGS